MTTVIIVQEPGDVEAPVMTKKARIGLVDAKTSSPNWEIVFFPRPSSLTCPFSAKGQH